MIGQRPSSTAEIIGRQRPQSVMPVTEAAASLPPPNVRVAFLGACFTEMIALSGCLSTTASYENRQDRGCSLAQWMGR